jgi:hypothetical protein
MNKIQLADQPCWAGRDEGEQRRRAVRYGRLLGKIEGDAPLIRAINPAARCYDYLRFTNDNSWTRSILKLYAGYTGPIDVSLPDYRAALALACSNWCTTMHLDGIYLDTPFEVPPGHEHAMLTAVAGVANAIDPRRRSVVCNFGDLFTWSDSKDDVAVAMGNMLHVHFVQDAISTSGFTMERWDLVKREALKRVTGGKELILGITDPQSANPDLAALLVASFQHPNLWWFYQNQWADIAEGTPVESVQWNPRYELLLGAA